MHTDGLVVPFQVELRKAIAYIKAFLSLLHFGHNATLRRFGFQRSEEVFWSDKSRIARFHYSWEQEMVYHSLSFEQVNTQRRVFEARGFVEEYAQVRVFSCAVTGLSSFAGAQRQIREYYMNVDGSGSNGGNNDQDEPGSIPVRFQPLLAPSLNL